MTFRFGNHVLDVECLELRSNGELVAMEPQVFSLLQFLIENHERVISKDELIEHVWNGRIVSDATLNTRVNGARRAVGDNGKEQLIIRTYPRRGFRFVGKLETDQLTSRSVSSNENIVTDLPLKPSIAVLPFKNLSNEIDQNYFADGISDDIVTSLSRMRWLFVVSRNSSFQFRELGESPREIARALNVRYLLEGNIRRMSGHIRISCQLTDAESLVHIWSEKYDGKLEDIFHLQDEITTAISTVLVAEITLAEIERVRNRHPDNHNAWDRYIFALALMHKLEKTANEHAKIEFHIALEIDPDFVSPHVGLAWCYALEALNGWSDQGWKSLEKVKRHARAAIASDQNDPRAHCALALAHFWVGELSESITTVLNAINLDANMPEAYGILGNALATSGKAHQAGEPLERALKGSPRDPMRWFWYHGIANMHFSLGDYGEASKWAKMTSTLREGWAFGHLIAAASAGLDERIEEAQRELHMLHDIIPDYNLKRFKNNPIWGHEPDIEKLIAGLIKAGLNPAGPVRD